MTFIEAPAFTRHLPSYLSDDEYRRLQEALLANPTAGAVIQGTGGFRKVRWLDPRRGRGTRGGLRIIYFTATEKRALKAAIDAERRARVRQHPKTKRRTR